MDIPKYVIIEKKIGETPLSCIENWRKSQPNELKMLPMAYAGRLDPMASGKLLILIGDECKQQTEYHSLDKEYEFSVLFGVSSDTGDVLGRLTLSTTPHCEITKDALMPILSSMRGEIELPYPHFSAKTVRGKPLHMWTLEKRLDEIIVPSKKSQVYSLQIHSIEQKDRRAIYHEALTKINSIPKVTDERKVLGNDFRREDIRKDWLLFNNSGKANDFFTIVTLKCIASSGTYMRSLAEEISRRLYNSENTSSLAYCIHRTKIGIYKQPFQIIGYWKKLF
jgi:tRNA pseudouridine(55) synthase